MSDNNNNNLSIQKQIEYNKRYQQQQMMTRSDSLPIRQSPYLSNTAQQYHDTYRMQQHQQQQQQQMYNYSRPQHFDPHNRYYPNRYPSMMSPYPSYSYPSHKQV
jgi:hypothetical protein